MRWVYIAGGILSIVIFGWVAIVKLGNQLPQLDFSGLHIQQKIWGVHVTNFTSEEKKWELWATESHLLGDNWLFDDVKLQVKNKKNQKYTLRGEKARFEKEGEDLELKGNVILNLDDKGQLRIDSVKYDVKSERLISDTPLHILNKDSKDTTYQMWGGGLKFYVNEGKIVLHQGVRWQVEFKNNKNSRLTARTGYYWLHDRVAQLKGRVVGHYGSFKITGQKADLVWKKGAIYAVQILGNVRVTDAHRSARADRLLLRAEDKNLTLIGNSRLVQGSDDLSGHIIEFSEEDQKVRVSNARARFEQPEEKF